MENYSSNSYKSKQEQAANNAEVKKVVKGSVKLKKKTAYQKFADIFIAEDIGNIKNYIIYDVLVPNIKDLILETVKTVLNGSSNNSTRRTNSSKISYINCYDKTKRRNYDSNSRTGYDFNDVIVSSRGEGEEVISHMDDLISTYGIVSVADLYDLVGISGSYTDNKYGWTNIRNAQVVRLGKDEYLIKLPRAIPID